MGVEIAITVAREEPRVAVLDGGSSRISSGSCEAQGLCREHL